MIHKIHYILVGISQRKTAILFSVPVKKGKVIPITELCGPEGG